MSRTAWTPSDAERTLYAAAVNRPTDSGTYALIKLVEDEHPGGLAGRYIVEDVLDAAVIRREVAEIVAKYEGMGDPAALAIANADRRLVAELDAAYGYQQTGE